MINNIKYLVSNISINIKNILIKNMKNSFHQRDKQRFLLSMRQFIKCASETINAS